MATLAEVYTGLTGLAAPSGGAAAVTPWVMNSQLVVAGGGFVARPGQSAWSPDGHNYIGDALQRGAAAIVAERARTDLSNLQAQVIDLADPAVEQLQPPVVFLTDDSMATMQKVAAWWRGQANPALRVIGITGSVGKTTVKELVAAVLSNRYRTWKSRGNYNSDIGLPLTMLDMPLDVERAVVELGMTRLGEIAELCAIALPDVGVITNVGPSHLERLGSIEAIAQAKGELAANLSAEGVAILNGDDEWVRGMAARTPATVWTYGLSPEFTLWADEIESQGLDGISLRFHLDNKSVAAKLPLLGRHSVHAALAAASVGLNEGQGWGEIIAGLKDPGKMEVLRIVVAEGVNGSTLIDDSYNASPDSVLAALNLLHDLDGRKIAVLGDMLELGSYTETGHKLIARRAAVVADLFVAIGEMATWMAQEAEETGLSAEAIFATKERDEAATWLKGQLQPGDMVLVKASRGLRLDELVTQLSVTEGDV